MSARTPESGRVVLNETPLDLEECVTCGQVFLWRRLPSGRWLGVDGDAWLVVEVHRDRLQVSGEACGEAPVARLRRLFRLDENLDALREAILAKGPELAPHLGRWPGLRMARPSCPVETLFCFLCTANNNLGRIGGMTAWLHARGDRVGEVEGFAVRRFPNLERLAEITEEDLRRAGFGYRAKTIPEVARETLRRGGVAWLLGLREASYEDAHAVLMELPGVGPKLADCIALFALHHTRAVPVDTHLWRAAIRVYFPSFLGARPTPARARQIGDHLRARFGDLAGWVQHFLFVDALRERRRPGG